MATFRGVPLSVLDLAPVVTGSTPSAALAQTLELARHADDLGFRRYWMAEHHNMPGIASSSPPVLIAAVAAATTSMRVGSGGVMLPNHMPLVVAEQFGTLAALHPGRIDLGIGRAPGTDGLTAHALRGSSDPRLVEEFPQHLAQVRAFLSGEWPDDHPYAAITATPGRGEDVPVWLLGSSDYSARAAAALGLPFSFAHHFSAANTVPALQLYRDGFQPSAALAAPYAMVAVSVVLADDDERAQWLAGPMKLSMLRLRSGAPGPLPTPEEAAAHEFAPAELELLAPFLGGQIAGGPDTVRRELSALVERTGADELMVVTTVTPHADRLRSYELLAALRP
ncbi:LLM class flavin-dependent oxidoreductase [Jiangella alba]|uniref:Luciferase family oxidoreductase, group 1 n=1 Tax=Jiangella alba TaxID=561176 RepID=A0A1H5K918_9ACTN|nr:LLM class flavin-dependent oxidoreductase [Jiangella alba]SEE60511.1 luciferase family oxidoreductase, group 1 [Jiangella alba]